MSISLLMWRQACTCPTVSHIVRVVHFFLGIDRREAVLLVRYPIHRIQTEKSIVSYLSTVSLLHSYMLSVPSQRMRAIISRNTYPSHIRFPPIIRKRRQGRWYHLLRYSSPMALSLMDYTHRKTGILWTCTIYHRDSTESLLSACPRPHHGEVSTECLRNMSIMIVQ